MELLQIFSICAVFAAAMTTSVVLSVATSPQEPSMEPEFAEPIPNVTVSAGRDVSLPCVVDNLGTFRVAWIHTQRYTLLTLQNRVITRNSRYKVTHNSHRTWWLHIADVQERDRGEYMCQINTSPMKSQTGFIEVVVPPHIEEEETSSDTEVREGSDVSLRCVAKGSPDPETTWRREDGQEITIGRKKVSSVKSTELNITKVGRLQMGAYLCIASNGVQPSVSKRIVLNVNFPPMIWIPSQLVGAPVGTDVTLACNLESFPQSVTYWNRESGTMVLTNDKYNSVLLNKGLYKISMQLTIRNLKPEDFGAYTCVAKNSLGETEGTIRLYEIPPPSSPATSQGPEPLRPKSEKLRNGHPQNAQAKMEETGSTEVQYGPSPSFNASSFSSENYFPPTNSNTEPGVGTISSAAEKLTSLYLYYVLYFVVCQWFSFRGIS
ncbi:protein CEPU-1 [Trichonephila clavata]|uniref:Protein CEPU-1 n=1 Tax=Trichonephila clavata TaxID=2740835 RepID=A0A8X6K5Q0_TRICU|nr:protein CEPU-1 [Trichonephila clavata]